tara:strand:- start:603 stop:1370 length:768 start_codon:yes stop_codon:yes gene_type:complete
MLMVLSPSKTMDHKTPSITKNYSIPEYLEKSEELVKVVQKKKSEELMDLMKISQKIAELNVNRFNSWHLPFNKENSKQAVLAFKGDVYSGLNANNLSENKLKYAQKHLRIISGLYGLLRPLDLMQPYRLEMGLKLKTRSAVDLYEFWGEKITDAINILLEKENEPVLINLASNEYFKSINKEKIDCRLITPEFKDFKNGKYKMISFFAKKARGMMARYSIENNILDPNELKNFDYEGYSYNSELSKVNNWVFCRG